MPRRQAVARQIAMATIRLGPFGGVNDTVDDGEARPTILQDLTNGYIPDPARGSDVYERPGFTATVNGLNTSAKIQHAGHEHVGTDGTLSRFVVCGGQVYRLASDLATTTLVTPAGITIDTSARVYLTSFGDTILVNDGVNVPWRLTNPTSTPVTGTKIDLDGAGSAWVARGRPAIYAAKAFFILVSVAAGVDVGTYGNTLVWSEEADASIGYRQSGYDNLWELTQTSTAPIYALAPTNSVLYYFRETQIGAIAGTVNATFQTTATHDAVSQTVGTTLSATVIEAENSLYFADSTGRPWRLPIGGQPQPIWTQMRDAIRLVETLGGSGPTAITSLTTTACAAYCPDLRVVVFALWTGDVLNTAPANSLWAFAAETGAYVGRWALLAVQTGYQAPSSAAFVDSFGLLRGSSGAQRLMLGGTNQFGVWPGGVARGTLWKQLLIADGATGGDTNASVPASRRAFGWVSPVLAIDDITETQLVEVAADGVCETDGPTANAGLVPPNTMTLTYVTPYGTSSGLSALMKAATSVPSGQSSNVALSRWRAAWGLANCVGRWTRLAGSFTESVAGNPAISLGSIECRAASAGRAVTK